MSNTDEHDFFLSGPSRLTVVDWEKPDHRRIVVASLVQGVYVLQSDRMNGRQDSQALAPPWWTSFQFSVTEVLLDPEDSSIFGAVYQLNPAAIASKSPKFVVAFLGTQIKKGTIFEDLKSDWKILINKLFERTRFKQSIETVIDLVPSSDGANVWLAGHSLGAALSLLIGKELAKNNLELETYLFNPPNTSFPKDVFLNDGTLKKLTNAARTVKRFGVTVCKAAIGGFIGPALDYIQGRVDPSEAICEWVPHLYVNPADPISSEYIGYFKNRETTWKIGLEKVERIANKVSLFPISRGSEPLHLLASAELIINEDKSVPLSLQKYVSKKWLKHHALRQWYDVDLHCKTDKYPHMPLITEYSSD